MTHRPELVAHGVRLGEQVVPLLAGSVHYYHLAVEHWRPALTEVRALGLSFVDTYVPWSVHERAGQCDFGSLHPELNVRHFLELARELGLYAIVRPGPHVNAELTGFGIPKRVLWDEECMARSANGSRVVLPIPPLAFPLPSYASPKFQEETSRWYQQVGSVLGDLCYPAGPIVFVQVDNEATLGFRDGVFDQDYHPAQLNEYREFLTRKYPNLEALRRLYKNPALVVSKSNPPDRKQLKLASDLPAALDWAEAQEGTLARALERMALLLRELFPGALLTHNLPPGWEASVLDAELLDRTFDLVGADYYHRASPPHRRAIFQRTSELGFRARSRGRPCFAAELGVGFPPYFSPHAEGDSRFTALCALAYGLQGFNLYMTVERSRWIGAPIDHTGTPLAEADFYRQLVLAVQ
ncbi:MAG TPA: beta-galactosidase, partial [Polyangiaceae bacterium]|nr:beta-galactosidase [Polyangiaceae bacterium]